MLEHMSFDYWLSCKLIVPVKLIITELSVSFSIKVHITSEWQGDISQSSGIISTT